MKIVVTQDDIKTGNRMGCHTCPVALAILAALGRKRGSRWVSVGSDAVHVGNSPIAIALPARVREFIKSFDRRPIIRRSQFEPFTFELDLPEEEARA